MPAKSWWPLGSRATIAFTIGVPVRHGVGSLTMGRRAEACKAGLCLGLCVLVALRRVRSMSVCRAGCGCAMGVLVCSEVC